MEPAEKRLSKNSVVILVGALGLLFYGLWDLKSDVTREMAELRVDLVRELAELRVASIEELLEHKIEFETRINEQ